jgi:hypothetical protein
MNYQDDLDEGHLTAGQGQPSCCAGIPGCNCCRHGILPTPVEIKMFNEKQELMIQLEEAQRNGQRFRDECERLQTLAARFQGEVDDQKIEYEARIIKMHATIRDLQAKWNVTTLERDDAEKCDEIMTTGVVALTEALQSMLGIFDNPIARRRIGGEMAEEARALARKALGKE